MKQPSLDILMSKVDSKYTLVVTAAKRARAVMDKYDADELDETKPVSIALMEIAQGKIGYELVREGIK